MTENQTVERIVYQRSCDEIRKTRASTGKVVTNKVGLRLSHFSFKCREQLGMGIGK